MSDDFHYNDIPYPSFTFLQTHPDRLATLATLYGMTPAKVENCRVLELGCGDGSNLNAMAYTVPTSKFVGIDLSRKHIDDAKSAAKEIGLENTEFYELDVLKVNVETFGKFDYIIAHGLFSWVPEVVREGVLQIYRQMLNEDGIGYISYNVFPGCHLREITRNIMVFHVKEISEPHKQVEESLRFIDFMRKNLKPDSLYQRIINEEFLSFGGRTAEGLFHDDLSSVNQPFYFSDFIDQAGKYDLQFLAESEFFSSHQKHHSPNIQEILASFGDDVLKIEQYMDFFKARRFRQTLLCHKDISINREILPAIIRKFSISSQLKSISKNPNLEPKTIEEFTTHSDSTFKIDHALTKAALVFLSRIWSKSIPFADLISEAKKLFGDGKVSFSENDVEITTIVLLQLFEAGFINLHVFAPQFVTKVSNKPLASSFARFQAKTGNRATSIPGTLFSLDDKLLSKLLIMLDGENDKKSILTRLRKDKSFKMIKNLGEFFDENTEQFALNGLLIA